MILSLKAQNNVKFKILQIANSM